MNLVVLLWQNDKQLVRKESYSEKCGATLIYPQGCSGVNLVLSVCLEREFLKAKKDLHYLRVTGVTKTSEWQFRVIQMR